MHMSRISLGLQLFESLVQVLGREQFGIGRMLQEWCYVLSQPDDIVIRQLPAHPFTPSTGLMVANTFGLVQRRLQQL